MAVSEKARLIIATFVKWRNDPIRLNSFILFEYETGTSGRYYLSRTEYDVEWSSRYGSYLFHQSGGGGGRRIHVEGIYHVGGNLVLDLDLIERAPKWVGDRDRPPWRGKQTQKIRRRNQTRRLRQLPMCINEMSPGWDLLDWLRSNAIESGALSVQNVTTGCQTTTIHATTFGGAIIRLGGQPRAIVAAALITTKRSDEWLAIKR